MPYAPARPCSEPGCPGLTTHRKGRCATHLRLRNAEETDRRGTASQRGYGAKWRKARIRWLQEHPLCVTCDAEGRVVAATVVDHIVPHKGDQRLFWDRRNWQSLCKYHHDQKTAGETFHPLPY